MVKLKPEHYHQQVLGKKMIKLCKALSKAGKEYPYYTAFILLAILKVLGIIELSWWIITIPIWWWWPMAIAVTLFVITVLVIEEIIKK